MQWAFQFFGATFTPNAASTPLLNVWKRLAERSDANGTILKSTHGGGLPKDRGVVGACRASIGFSGCPAQLITHLATALWQYHAHSCSLCKLVGELLRDGPCAALLNVHPF